MRTTFKAALAAMPLLMATTATAAPAVSRSIRVEAPAAIVKVGYSESRSSRKYRRGDGVIVDAPTTRVETRRGRTVVDAPYAYVERSSSGIRVQAPFVNLYIRR